jgi:hypothetical protein
MDWATAEDTLALRCAGVLCAASALAWIYFAATWTRSKTAGGIKLPSANEDPLEPDALLDEDIPRDLETWKKHILWRKLVCTAAAAAALLAWSTLLYTDGNNIILLQWYFCVS